MASLRRLPRSPFFFACFSLPDGKRVQRSTKETTRKKAQQKADEWERLSKDRAKARQAHKVIAGFIGLPTRRNYPTPRPKAFIAGWLIRKKPEIAKASYDSYEGRTRHFLIWLGSSAESPLAERKPAASSPTATTSQRACLPPPPTSPSKSSVSCLRMPGVTDLSQRIPPRTALSSKRMAALRGGLLR